MTNQQKQKCEYYQLCRWYKLHCFEDKCYRALELEGILDMEKLKDLTKLLENEENDG